MGKKGKRTKWQALPMEEDSTAANGNGAVGYKKFRPFSTYNGDNSYKTAVLGPDAGFNLARQQTNEFEKGLPGGLGSEATQRMATETPAKESVYLAEKGQDAHNAHQELSTNASVTSGVSGGYHRYNRDYPNGGRNFSTYKSRYQSSNYASRDSHSIHSNYSATHHKSSGASSNDASSTTSSNYQNYENGWRPSRNPHYKRSYNQYNGYNKENSTNQVSGNDEYTRITTPRQDVLFKKGYLSRPKRQEEDYLGPPLISQQLQPHDGSDAGDVTVAPADADPAAVITEDNSPLYFYPGFVDHNGYFHANPTFMPNTFDQFGQPIVMMPYPPQSSTAAGEPGDEAVPLESSDNLAPEDGAVLTNDLVVTAEAPELIIQEEKQIQLNERIEGSQIEASVDLEINNEIVDPQLAESLSEAIPEEVPPTECPEQLVDGEPVNNAMPLDPASNSFYPQSSMYPYYPMVFTPQQLPPNTSIIPLADLYYNENYAGLAAEIFGLTETANTQSDDSTEQSCDEPQLPSSEEVVTLGESNGFILDPVEDAPAQDLADDPTTELIADSVDGAPSNVHHLQMIISEPVAEPVENQFCVSPKENETEAPVKIESTEELAANSNLKVDVEEFHPRIPNYPTPAQAAHVSHQRQIRNQNNNAPVSYPTNHHEQFTRRRGEEEFRRRRFHNDNTNAFNRPSFRKQLNNAVTSNPVSKAVVEEQKHVENKTPEGALAEAEKSPTTNAQKTNNKSANKVNSKRAIQASIKNIEQQNIDLSKTKITATQSATAIPDSNQWLVKTKGKKSRVILPIDIPEDDMFEVECEEAKDMFVKAEPELIVRSSTPVMEVQLVLEETVEERVENKTTQVLSSKQKKSPSAKTSSPTAKAKGNKNGGNKKSKASAGKVANSSRSKGFAVIEPDFGVITRLKTDPISFDSELQEELENILNMKDVDEQELNRSELLFEEDPVFRSTSLPKSPRAEKDNVIDLDDLEALERSLMDFDLSGELKERMIEIIQSEMEVPLGGTDIGIEEEAEVDLALVLPCPVEEEQVEVVQEVLTIIPEPKEPESIETPVMENEHCEAQSVDEEAQQEDVPEVVVIDVKASTITPLADEEEKAVTAVEENEENVVVTNHDAMLAAEEHTEQRELNIITSGMTMDEIGPGSSSSSSSLSSPIPTDDGRDGSNSESDDAMTPPAILPEDQEKKMVLPCQLEGRLLARGQVRDDVPELTPEPQVQGIAASVSKWLEEKSKECSQEPILRIPNDPQVAKLIFKAMYGVDLALEGEEDEEFETEDDMDSLSADESDFESDARDPLRDLLGISREKRDNQVPIDTDSDYMSDGQNIKPVDVGKLPNTTAAGSAELKSSAEAVRGVRGASAKTCKVM